MQQALAEAQAAGERGEIPVGAVIVHKERIIARAHNLTETLRDVTAHAEMQAITAAADVLGAKYPPECTLHVPPEPRAMCARAHGVAPLATAPRRASAAKRGYRRFATAALHPKTEVTHGIMQDECARLLTDFFKKRR